MTRVLLISRNLLFRSGIQSLLTHQAEVEIVGQEAEPARAIVRVKELQPDVVIVDSDFQQGDPAELALAILRAGIRARVIELGLKDNAIHIYRKERRIAHGVEDLMKAMESDFSDLVSPAEISTLATVRSRLYGFLGAVFNRLPDKQFATSLASGELSNLLATIAEVEDLTADVREGLELIKQYIQQVKGKPVEELKTELAVDRTRLVRGLTPALSPLPPYESEYVGGAEHIMAASMSVAREYAAAGVALPKEVSERPDFIGFELDFMRHLCEQEAQAWSEQDRPGALALMQKERAFLDAHLARWVPRFCDAMSDKAQLDFYRGIARMTKGVVLGDAQKQAELADWAAM